ncbi:MAG: ATPase, T2SS/T4P/T4SS family [Gammaproteobacteria bacterium]
MLNREITYLSLANHLVNYGLLEQKMALHAIECAKTQEISIISYLVKNKILSSTDILQCCENIFSLTSFDLQRYDPAWLAASALSPEFIRQYRVIPLKKINNILQVGLADPTDQQALDTLAFQTGFRVTPVLVAEDQLAAFIESYCSKQDVNKNLQMNLLKQITLDDPLQATHERNIQYDEPLIQFVDNIILHAFQQSASDIHIEPYETICRIRYRQHGVLYPIHEIPIPLAARVATRLKVIARLDISERRLPQDGRFQLNLIDIRINTCPTLFGEKIVLRLLNTGNISLNINDLDLSSAQKRLFLKSISQPQGMILVTGPTGSGKTVTLYSALNFLNQTEKNISTVEDPIEIRLSGINQVNVNAKIGLTFSTVLRTFLRQDPDIIMLGEIRDTETANIAIQAAQTGHLVLSTLHTNCAIESVTRLQAMGVLSYNIAGSISLIIAQRLIRKLCPHCKQPENISDQLIAELNLEQYKLPQKIYRAIGCSKCSQGYTDRLAIYEFVRITEQLAKLITLGADIQALIHQAKLDGFIPLKEAGIKQVLQGITSLSEINRVLLS